VTSLGYGDLYPTHIYSRILISVCSIIGLVVIVMPITAMYQNAKEGRRNIRYMYSDQIAVRI
jgi:hypothetical protein